MSPVPVLRTQLAVLGLYCRRLVPQIGAAIATILVASIVSVALGYGMGVVLIGAVISHSWVMLILGSLVSLVLQLTVQLTAQALLWARADRLLLSAKPGSFSVIALLKSAGFIVLLLGGVLILMVVGELVVPPLLGAHIASSASVSGGSVHTGHLQFTGQNTWVFWAIPVAVLLLNMSLLVRAAYLPVVVAIDGGTMSGTWRLWLETTRGKTVPLLFSLLGPAVLGVLATVGYLLILHTSIAASLNGSKTGAHPYVVLVGALLAEAVLMGAVSSLTAALQVGTVRHFVGYNASEGDHYVVNEWDEHMERPIHREVEHIYRDNDLQEADMLVAPAPAYYDPSAVNNDEPAPVEQPSLPPAPTPGVMSAPPPLHAPEADLPFMSEPPPLVDHTLSAMDFDEEIAVPLPSSPPAPAPGLAAPPALRPAAELTHDERMAADPVYADAFRRALGRAGAPAPLPAAAPPSGGHTEQPPAASAPALPAGGAPPLPPAPDVMTLSHLDVRPLPAVADDDDPFAALSDDGEQGPRDDDPFASLR